MKFVWQDFYPRSAHLWSKRCRSVSKNKLFVYLLCKMDIQISDQPSSTFTVSLYQARSLSESLAITTLHGIVMDIFRCKTVCVITIPSRSIHASPRQCKTTFKSKKKIIRLHFVLILNLLLSFMSFCNISCAQYTYKLNECFIIFHSIRICLCLLRKTAINLYSYSRNSLV